MTGVDDGDRRAPRIRAAWPGDAPAIAAVHVAAWREAYAGILPAAMLAGLSVETRATFWADLLGAAAPDGAVVLVAESEGETVGFVAAGPRRDAALGARGFAGEIGALYVLRRAQRRGKGRALLRAAAGALADRGRRGASLWVLRENAPARAFYEALGGAAIAERETRDDGASLVEIAYGWPDLAALAAGRARPSAGRGRDST